MTTVALIGNPNCGKTTIFNKLTGSSQRVGNWPGVTIERKVGKLIGHPAVDIVDLPGVYSLTPYSPEEVVTRDFLSEELPDVVINIVDASNLERNLYLTTQITEMGIPVVIALNMMDIAENRGIVIDISKLSSNIHCEVVPTCALKNEGIDELVEFTLHSVGKTPKPLKFSDEMEKSISDIESIIESKSRINKRWYAIKLLETDSLARSVYKDRMGEIEPIIKELERVKDDTGESIVADERYTAIEKIVKLSRTETQIGKVTLSDKIDKYVTHRIYGLPIFAGILFVVYCFAMGSPFGGDVPPWAIGAYMTEHLNGFFSDTAIPFIKDWMVSANVDPTLTSLVTDGILVGVFAVLGFVPQILVLFMFLSILEDCGYMTRVCFVMDRLFRKFNLSGKSFIPLLVSTGCGVPGIMASRTIENECDRELTAMTTTFIPCSAKLPVIALITAALFSGSPFVAVFAYFLGVFCVLLSGIILKKWKTFAGEASVFIMELSPYHAPKAMTVARTTFERGWSFAKKAGTVILLASVVIWVLSRFTWGFEFLSADEIGKSMLADIGSAISVIFVPLGWGEHWEFTVATLAGLVAKEEIIGSFGVLFGVSDPADIIGTMISSVAGLSFLTFNLICAPCLAAIAAIKKEVGWHHAIFAIVYQCILAYAIALIIYQFGLVLSGGFDLIGMIMAITALAILIAVTFMKNPFKIFKRGIPQNKDGGNC